MRPTALPLAYGADADLLQHKACEFICCGLRSVCAGIDASNARYILLVDSDTFVVRGSLYAMWSTFRAHADVGMVGPMLIGKGLLLTEAGGVIWADGSVANFGRGDSYRSTVVRAVCGWELFQRTRTLPTLCNRHCAGVLHLCRCTTATTAFACSTPTREMSTTSALHS
jgi:hypothetical protein